MAAAADAVYQVERSLDRWADKRWDCRARAVVEQRRKAVAEQHQAAARAQVKQAKAAAAVIPW